VLILQQHNLYELQIEKRKEKKQTEKWEGCHEGGHYENILFILLEEPANNVLEVRHTLITNTYTCTRTHTHVSGIFHSLYKNMFLLY